METASHFFSLLSLNRVIKPAIVTIGVAFDATTSAADLCNFAAAISPIDAANSAAGLGFDALFWALNNTSFTSR
jgi:hypothetical protein